ncbi:leucine dehydrogenase, partial [Gelidibacter salicanalis]|nr:leucine dehydrogenase [Gelidibacter salicanalis]
QLAQHDGAEALSERGILWAPDFVVNGGGVIYLDMASEPDADADAITKRVEAIGDTVTTIFRDAAAQSITTLDAAERLAQS